MQVKVKNIHQLLDTLSSTPKKLPEVRVAWPCLSHVQWDTRYLSSKHNIRHLIRVTVLIAFNSKILSSSDPHLTHYSDIVSDIPWGSTYRLYILTFFLACYSGILFGIYSYILSAMCADILSGILSGSQVGKNCTGYSTQSVKQQTQWQPGRKLLVKFDFLWTQTPPRI